MSNRQISADGKSILRFSRGSRLAHGVHAIVFLLLLFTGCAIAFQGLGNLIGHDLLKRFVQIHKVLGFAFLAGPIILLLFSGKNAARWLKDTFSFGKNDLGFVLAFPKEFFTGHAQTPPQGRYNGGEKINSMLQIAAFFVMLVTGGILYLDSASPAVVGWSAAIHSFCGLCLGAVVIAHAYLGLLHPGSKASITGMLTGWVPMSFARSHHPLWVAEVEAAEAEKDKEEQACLPQ
jgi:formate dehydrogenase subunit gamma